MQEKEFRQLADQLFQHILRGFEGVDPDDAECEEALGVLTITLASGARWVLSMQPPVSQVWLAVASIGRAYHFRHTAKDGTWRDIRDDTRELLTLLTGLMREHAQVTVAF